jgi:hypothetical protein
MYSTTYYKSMYVTLDTVVHLFRRARRDSNPTPLKWSDLTHYRLRYASTTRSMLTGYIWIRTKHVFVRGMHKFVSTRRDSNPTPLTCSDLTHYRLSYESTTRSMLTGYIWIRTFHVFVQDAQVREMCVHMPFCWTNHMISHGFVNTRGRSLRRVHIHCTAYIHM